MTRQNKAAAAPLILGAVFLCIGIAQGDYRDVSRKAARVCLKCIGVG